LLAAGLADELPYSRRDPIRQSARGSAVYSRYPLTDTGLQHLPQQWQQSYATVHVPGALPVQVYAVHSVVPPEEPSPLANWRRSLAEEPPATPDGTVRLLVGDFNSTLDQAPLRDLRATGYRDIADVLGDGLVPTWPYDGRGIPTITIDHIFADPRIGAVS